MTAHFCPVILVYNHFDGWRPPARLDCPIACELTTDRARLDGADAVVYHIPTWRGPYRIARRPGQIGIALSLESEVNYPLLADPVFMSQFDLTMTYRQDSTIWCAYLGPDLARELRSPCRQKTEAAPAVYFASNPFERSGRTKYALELMKRLKVDSYGRVLKNRRLDHDRGRATKLATIARYRFTLAFENSVCRDYVTEKFFDSLVAGSVPVYLGAPNIREFAPAEHCFIDTTDFAEPAELAAYLAELAADEAAYGRYLAWKDRPLDARFLEKCQGQRMSAWCRLCLLLHSRRAAPPIRRGGPPWKFARR